MERKVVLVCSIVGLFGILAAALGFVAEAIRIVDSAVIANNHCLHRPSLLASLLGLIAALALLISQIVLNVSTGCICCIKSPRFPDSNWGVALISFILSWFTFFIAVLNFLNGVLFGNFNCHAWRVGGFAGGALIALANSAFGIVYYLTLTATKMNGGNTARKSSNRNPTLEGIAMGQPQIPEVNEDPVFVHEDTYNRRQFP